MFYFFLLVTCSMKSLPQWFYKVIFIILKVKSQQVFALNFVIQAHQVKI